MTEHAKGWPYPIRDVGGSWAYGCPRCGVIQRHWEGTGPAPWQIGERLTEALNRAPGRHV